jgi:hypothetical protein
MKCPHCSSHMQIYDKNTTRVSEVSFYRCSICVAEHVSSSMVTVDQLTLFNPSASGISGDTSQIKFPRMI